MCYKIDLFRQTLISFRYQQMAIFNIAMKTSKYLDLPFLSDMQFYSFAALKDKVFVTGGLDYENDDTNSKQVMKRTRIIDIPNMNDLKV